MSQYVVVTPEGKRYGPTDFQTLSQWAGDGRVVPGMTVEDLLSGQTMTASAVPGLFENQPAPYANYARPGPQAPSGFRGRTAMTLGLIGLVAWCLPILGFGFGVAAIVAGVRALNSSERTQALVGIVLGATCLLLSIANLIAGAILLASLRK